MKPSFARYVYYDEVSVDSNERSHSIFEPSEEEEEEDYIENEDLAWRIENQDPFTPLVSTHTSRRVTDLSHIERLSDSVRRSANSPRPLRIPMKTPFTPLCVRPHGWLKEHGYVSTVRVSSKHELNDSHAVFLEDGSSHQDSTTWSQNSSCHLLTASKSRHSPSFDRKRSQFFVSEKSNRPLQSHRQDDRSTFANRLSCLAGQTNHSESTPLYRPRTLLRKDDDIDLDSPGLINSTKPAESSRKSARLKSSSSGASSSLLQDTRTISPKTVEPGRLPISLSRPSKCAPDQINSSHSIDQVHSFYSSVDSSCPIYPAKTSLGWLSPSSIRSPLSEKTNTTYQINDSITSNSLNTPIYNEYSRSIGTKSIASTDFLKSKRANEFSQISEMSIQSNHQSMYSVAYSSSYMDETNTSIRTVDFSSVGRSPSLNEADLSVRTVGSPVSLINSPGSCYSYRLGSRRPLDNFALRVERTKKIKKLS
ncbi:uncharacterized protein LOC126313337 isoform X2 [Schistocerca gregaria]|uniref:uncharacterized protein LOC126313337 isoform X2 n=1 Tax=Schistocerca gregaria TaxID=7010 RepID=UPI00211E4EE5|nr:uncharacterized protein LOC126313337 isoform X2 [Schistocerca gregaria]